MQINVDSGSIAAMHYASCESRVVFSGDAGEVSRLKPATRTCSINISFSLSLWFQINMPDQTVRPVCRAQIFIIAAPSQIRVQGITKSQTESLPFSL